MPTCKQCQKDILDGSLFCMFCGMSQNDQHKPQQSGVEIRDCKHCEGKGECRKGNTLGIIHSCEFCISKSGMRTDNLFPRVPCGYCEGRGFSVVDLKPQKQYQQKKQGRR